MKGVLNKGVESLGAVHRGYDKDGTRRHRATPTPVAGSHPLNAVHSVPGSSRPPVKQGNETRSDVGIK